MSKMEDPEITVKQALVMTVYPGATAHQVELEVSDKLEKAIRQMGDIDYIESKSLNDLSLIKVVLKTTVPNGELEQKWDILRKRLSMFIPNCLPVPQYQWYLMTSVLSMECSIR